ncbi:MAG: hypothetical protein HOP33_03030 [Verrucomicrobia bacterium]|nr:hypothetical protein [Verrucomicrobiota bacterium]
MRKSSVIKPVCSGLAILAGSFSFLGSAQAVTLLSEDFEGASNLFGTPTYNYAANYTLPNLLVPAGGLQYMTGAAGINGSVSTNIYPATGSPFTLAAGGITEAQIDGGTVSYNLYAQFSTYQAQNDNGTLSVQFLDSGSSPIGSPVRIGGAAFVSALGTGTTVPERAWAADTLLGVVPSGARFAAVEIIEVKTAGGTSIDGYMDNVNISIAVSPVPISVSTASPPDNAAGVHPAAAVSVVLRDGTPTLNNSSIQLSLDGSPVSPSIQKTGSDTTVTYDPPGFLPPSSVHTYKIAFNKDGGPVPNTTNQYSFTVGSYVDIILPSPIPGAFENFNSTPEGGVPTGWTVTNLDTQLDPTSEPFITMTNLDSAAYTNWTVVDAARFTSEFDTYSQLYNSLPQPPGEATDYQRVLSVNPFNVVNGTIVTNLATGRFAFGNSGYRLGLLGQVVYMFTKDFDVSGYTNVYLSFHSLWEQNQDSIGAVEYSVNQGAVWLPVVYMLDGPDVMTNLDGSIDALTTLTNVYTDVAQYNDPVLGIVGGYYGAFIGVDSNLWSTLAPYISRRVDNDTVGSKRVEIFRLPLADNQSKVRLRFAHAGTDSWYFGVDDVGLYNLPPLKINSIVAGGGNATVSWNGAAGTKLQKSSSLTSPDWQDVPGSNGASGAPQPATGVQTYYRLVRPY